MRERFGRVAGWLGAPAFGLISALRHTRTFHPAGVVLRASVEPLPEIDPHLRALGELLRGPALVRFSTAIWKRGQERVDALGCAVRFRDSDEATAEASPGDQDLLFATMRSPWTMALAPLATRVHDFLSNQYFAVAPFDVPGLGRVKWKLAPEHPGVPGASRRERLLESVDRGQATLLLEVRRTWSMRYVPVARLVLRELVTVDQEALRFSPFRTGRDIEPRGFVHALRRGAYAGSQAIGASRREGHAAME
jgi:hypothetical protein